MATFTPLSLITFFGGAQGILVAIAIVRSKGPNREANRILSLLILLISFVLLGSLMNVNDRALVNRHPHLIFFLDIPLLAFGPLIFLYVRKLLTCAPQASRDWKRHFLPAFLHQFHLLRYMLEPSQQTLERLATRDFPLAPYVITFATLQIGIYLLMSYRVVRQFRTQSLNERSEQPVLGYLSTFLFAMGACWLAWFLSGLVFIFPTVSLFQFLKPDIAWILMAMTTALLAYFAMAEKESLALNLQPRKYENSPLSSKKQNDLSFRLREWMKTEKPYLEPKLSLQDLATQLNIAGKDLSRVINETQNMNFFDFVNSYRISEFKRLASQNRLENETILAIAFEAGFNSKSTFNHSFKKLTGLTPAQYLKSTTPAAERSEALQEVS